MRTHKSSVVVANEENECTPFKMRDLHGVLPERINWRSKSISWEVSEQFDSTTSEMSIVLSAPHCGPHRSHNSRHTWHRCCDSTRSLDTTSWGLHAHTHTPYEKGPSENPSTHGRRTTLRTIHISAPVSVCSGCLPVCVFQTSKPHA